MLEINLSKTGALMYRAPHVYHEIIDNAVIDFPSYSFSNTMTYMPIYSEKGPSGVLKVFDGSESYSSLIETYGKPNIVKYGLPYSAAALHSTMGGAVVVQSLKPEGATHAAFVLNMVIEKDGNVENGINNTNRAIGGKIERLIAPTNKLIGYYNNHPLMLIGNKYVYYDFSKVGENDTALSRKLVQADSNASLATLNEFNKEGVKYISDATEYWQSDKVTQDELVYFYRSYLYNLTNGDMDTLANSGANAEGVDFETMFGSVPGIENIVEEKLANGDNPRPKQKFLPTNSQIIEWVAKYWKNGEYIKNILKANDIDVENSLPLFKQSVLDSPEFSNKMDEYAQKLFSTRTANGNQVEDPALKEAILNERLIIATVAKTQLVDKLNTFSEFLYSFWMPLFIPALRIRFESQPIDEFLEEERLNSEKMEAAARSGKPSSGNDDNIQIPGIAGLEGVTSWDALEVLVQRMSSANNKKQSLIKTINQIYGSIGANASGVGGLEFKLTVPILWGYVSGKGKYGNEYMLKFANTKSDVEGRPIYMASIINTRTLTTVKNSKKPVSFSNDFALGGVPLLIDSAYTDPYFDGSFKFKTASNTTMDEIGAVIEAFMKNVLYTDNGIQVFGYTPDGGNATAYKFKRKLVNNHIASYGPIGDKLLAKVKAEAAVFAEPEESTYHRLSKVDLTRLMDYNTITLSQGITDAKFSGGHEGEFQFMKEFDWNFNFQDPKLIAKYGPNSVADNKVKRLFAYYQFKYQNRKIVEEMFANAFSVNHSPEIKSLWTNKADYIIDMGYPLSVKEAITKLVTNYRDDIQVILNTDIHNTSIDQNIKYKDNLINTESRNILIVPGSFEWVDTVSQRSARVPASFMLLPNLLSHFNNGYSNSLAGYDRGAIRYAQPNSLRGVGNLSLAENDSLIRHGLNIFSTRGNGSVYLDSQMCNYVVDKYSPLQEFHNNSIVNRMIKDCYIALQKYKHMLANEQSVEIVQESINQELQKYKGKVEDFNYSCKFDSTYDKAIGLLTHSIDVKFFGTIKYHHIKITALPIT